MNRRVMPKKVTAAIVTVLMLCGVGAAYAYWTASGSGTGTASTATTAATVTVVQTSTVSNLRPGAAAQTLSGNFTNNSGGTAYVATVTASIASVTDTDGDAIVGCGVSDYELFDATMTVNSDIAVGTGVGSWSGATIAFVNKNTNQDACKGARVNLSYAVA